MLNYNQIKYSLMHREVLRLLAKKYNLDKSFIRRVQYHDMDKILLYMQESFLLAHSKHLLNIPHHLESSLKKDEDDYLETILDWDSARYTKKDKLLNAYQTLKKLYPAYYDIMLPILHKLNLDREYVEVDQEILGQVLANDYSPYKVLDEIIEYIKYAIDNESLYYNIYHVISNAYCCLTHDEKEYFKKNLGENIMNKIDTNKKIKIGIFTHRGCDYDALCSSLTLANYISKITDDNSLEVIPIIEDSPLKKDVFSDLKTYTLEEAKDINLDYSVICDVFERDRIYGLEKVLEVPSEHCYVIDHHDKNREEINIPESNKMIYPHSSSTCEILTQLFNYLEYDFNQEEAINLYRGIASDTAIFSRGLTDCTMEMVDTLCLDNKIKEDIVKDLTKISPIQEELLNKVKVDEHSTDYLRIYTLLEPIEAGDITKHLKHESFDKLTAPTDENPVTCFIIGCGDNYFLKFKKLADNDTDILTVATNCNGGGHENRCAGRFYNSSIEYVFEKLFMEFNKVIEDKQVTEFNNENDQKQLKRTTN